MDFESEDIEELLWDLDEFYEADHPLLEKAWAEFEESGDLPVKLLKKLLRMRKKAFESAA